MISQLTIHSPVQNIPYVGSIYAKKLEKLEIYTVENLLWHLPFRYDDYTNVKTISSLATGETASIKALVLDIKNVFTKNGKRMTMATLADDTGMFDAIWFNQIYLIKAIQKNQVYYFSGKTDWFGRKKSLMSPSYEMVKTDQIHTGRLVPVYPETEGVSSKWLRSRIASILKYNSYIIKDKLPDNIKNGYQLMNLSDALAAVHFPKNMDLAKLGKQRLAFEELLSLQLTSALRRKKWENDTVGHIFPVEKFQSQLDDFIKKLPFTLTSSQQTAVSEILADLEKTHPMNRLLEGDVGSGKTIVAAICIYLSYLCGFQSAFMAPTEILAQQHFETINNLFKSYKIKVKLATSTTAKKEKVKENWDVIIGTHSLLYDKVNYQNLGLIIIDEQQRFGVDQRENLRQKGTNPHLLSMTATPIPRTIALTLYGELDLSVLTEMPKGLSQIKTWVVPEEKRLSAYEWIKKNGQQIFVICPFIEESDSLNTVKAVKEEYKKLKDIFSDKKTGLLHGKMKSSEKNSVLSDFQKGKIDILVSTPVIEVGIDMPKADIMIIETADRFGLAQLHQLRGRIGRRGQKSYCLLFLDNDNELATKRLKYLETVYNGPKLAELDLKLRGSGEMYGTTQHGFIKLKAAQLSDEITITNTKHLAKKIITDGLLSKYPSLQELVSEEAFSVISN